MKRPLRLLSSIVLLAFVFLVNVSSVKATTLGGGSFSWDAVSDPSVSGYKVYWGTQSGVYDHWVDAANVTALTISEFTQGVEYFSAVTAYSATGEESGYSAEISFTVMPAAPNPVFCVRNLSLGAGGSVTFEVEGALGPELGVYASSDLVNWSLLTTQPLNGTSLTITDPGAVGAAKRFYRLADTGQP